MNGVCCSSATSTCQFGSDVIKIMLNKGQFYLEIRSQESRAVAFILKYGAYKQDRRLNDNQELSQSQSNDHKGFVLQLKG